MRVVSIMSLGTEKGQLPYIRIRGRRLPYFPARRLQPRDEEQETPTRWYTNRLATLVISDRNPQPIGGRVTRPAEQRL